MTKRKYFQLENVIKANKGRKDENVPQILCDEDSSPKFLTETCGPVQWTGLKKYAQRETPQLSTPVRQARSCHILTYV